MTSYPARMEYVARVWKSVFKQDGFEHIDKCVLALAEPEFPDKVLPDDLQELIDKQKVELIWYPTNIRSHKKIIPVLKKYPDATIIVIDDEMERLPGWLQPILEDHAKYPHDIISPAYVNYIDGNLQLQRFKDYKRQKAGPKNQVPGLVANFNRFNSGGAGALIPAHTFTDPRFFDEELMMRISPSSDESWMFCFAVIEDRTMRQTSKIFDESLGIISGSQQVGSALYKANRKNYPIILETMYREFPEFKQKLIERQHKVVVSLTSYPLRFPVLPKVLDSLLNQTVKPSKIVVYLADEDMEKLPTYLVDYSNKGIEFRGVPQDLKCHNKYFWAMQDFPTHAVITVDDDVIYAPTMVESLLKGYWAHPNCVVARRVHKMMVSTKDPKVIYPYYNMWSHKHKHILEPSEILFATGVGGVLYPAGCLSVSEENIPEIKTIIDADDIYLRYLERQHDIKILYVPDKHDKMIDDAVIQSQALSKTNVRSRKNDEYITKFLS